MKIEVLKATEDLHKQILSLFLKGLPANILAKDLVKYWGENWKNIKNEDFLVVLDEITRQTLSQIADLNELIVLWSSTVSNRLRQHIRNRIQEVFPLEKEQINKLLIILDYLKK